MKQGYSVALELAFFALALFWFIPEAKSELSPYDYFPEAGFVAVAIAISRGFAYRNGRALLICAVEAAIVLAAYLVHRMALNLILGYGI